MNAAHIHEFGGLIRDVRNPGKFDPNLAQGQQLQHRLDAVVVRPEFGRRPAHVVYDYGYVCVRQLICDVRKQTTVREQLQMEVVVTQSLQQWTKGRKLHQPAPAARITLFEVRHPHPFDASGSQLTQLSIVDIDVDSRHTGQAVGSLSQSAQKDVVVRAVEAGLNHHAVCDPHRLQRCPPLRQGSGLGRVRAPGNHGELISRCDDVKVAINDHDA